jgi:hypothetical protein
MTFRDELAAAMARIASLEKRLEERPPPTETEALQALRRAHADELHALKSQLALAKNELAAERAKSEAERQIAAAEKQRAKETLAAVEAVRRAESAAHEQLVFALRAQLSEVRRDARDQIERVATVSRDAWRADVERTLASLTERRRALAPSLAAPAPLPPGASIEAQIAAETALRARARSEAEARMLDERAQELERLLDLLRAPTCA